MYLDFVLISACQKAYDIACHICTLTLCLTGEPCAAEFYAAQISGAEFEQQAKENTRAAVDALIHSPEYQRKVTRCHL